MKPQEYLKALKAGAEVTLPSGLEARVRPVDSRVMLERDYTSDLLEIVHEKLGGTVKKGKDIDEMSPEELADINRRSLMFYNELAKIAVIEPKLVEKDPDQCEEDEFPVSLLEQGDLVWLWNMVNLPLVKLKPFCDQQTALMESVLNGEIEPPESEQALWTDADGAERDAGTVVPADQPVVDDISF